MKVLMFGSKEYPFGVSAKYDPKAGGGIEKHVEKLSKYLSRKGHVVFIITRRFPGQESEEHRSTIHVYRVPFIHNTYLRTLTFNLLSFLKALSIARKHRIDIIHSHGIVGSFFASLLSIFTRTPLVMTPHGTVDEWGLFKLPLKLFETLSLRTAKKVLFISRAAQRRIALRRRIPNTLLSNGIDFDDIPKQRKRTWKKTRFGFIGRLEEVKGITILLEAFTSLPRDDAELLIAGEGPFKNKVLEYSRKHRNIKFLGWRDPGEFFQNIDVFVLPSQEKGQPIALLEAMAHGKIILTTLNFIENGKTGILISGDIHTLSSAMLDISRNLKKHQQLGERARKEALSLSWERQVHFFIREYLSAIGQSSNTGIFI